MSLPVLLGARGIEASETHGEFGTTAVHAAVTLLAAGGWVTAAAILGPFVTPMPQILVAGGAGGLVLSVPWWAHGRRRARVRVERKLEIWPEIAQVVVAASRLP